MQTSIMIGFLTEWPISYDANRAFGAVGFFLFAA